MTSSRPALRMRDISKQFPGVRALSGVSLTVRFGTVHAIVGENGAGKSTLMKILSGTYQPTAGSIEIDGAEVRMHNPADGQKLGIRMVHQELNLVPDLTVAENVFLGRMPTRRGMLDRGEMVRNAARVLKELGTVIDPNCRLGDLTISQQQLVEIAKAYAAAPRIIVLDEPTSSLSEHEAGILFGVLRKMRDAGIAIIYISHRLREVLDIADEVTVLRDGAMIETRPVAGITAADMIRLMVGRDVSDLFPKAEAVIGSPVLEVENLSDGEHFAGVSFDVRAGEIVGLTGLVGAGRTEVARAIFGLSKRTAGTIRMRGQTVAPKSPADAMRAGIAYVPEDRKGDGIVPGMSVRENIGLPIIRSLTRMGWIKDSDEKQLAKHYAKRFSIVPPDPERRISTLSGGNQQKAVLAKWLAAKPALLILDEPTRGVDVGAKSDIHAIVGELVAEGIAVLMISSELPEVLAVCDRVVVMHEGNAAKPLMRDELSEEKIMALATGEGVQ
ncbi:sugar ABC transporter ATP-binding protein [Rhizobium sp. KVB221]|uniref:Sugar ABC transporter ATP-binding protein n=1 Tax=Rhizobium setariae TaxID=2801340 RepID=A0A936YS12_9HYPH|nr:sugar ABC transporter ATP-binding protein [Rhizobium setariae]MBL0373601.1 sugar ABC transporter ATP-binding protein [Rhizobium setariae]